MNRFMKWLDGLSTIDAAALILCTLFGSVMVSMVLLATGHVTTVIVIIVIALITLAVMIGRVNR